MRTLRKKHVISRVLLTLVALIILLPVVLTALYSFFSPEEIKALQRDYETLWEPLSDLLKKLSAVVEL